LIDTEYNPAMLVACLPGRSDQPVPVVSTPAMTKRENQSMANLTDLLMNLGQDADLSKAWENDPNAVMARYELSDSEKQALLSGDVEELKRASGLTSLHMTNGTVRSHDTDL
jgi:hypothetical protein